MASPKQIQLNFFETACTGSVHHLGQWRSPTDNSRYKDRLDYYIWLAQLAEKGKITSIFFADSYGANDVYGGSTDATYRGGAQVAQLDPVVVVSAMAAVTKSVGFALTGSASYLNPYTMARTWASLDHVTNGRIGWNIVTGYTNSSAKAFGKDALQSHEQRYEVAEEFVDIVYRLWEGSWDDNAQVWDVKNDTAYDPTKIHKIDYNGKFFKLSANQQTHPSPQRVPVLFQAGASKSGMALAAGHAEGLYCGSMLPSHTARYVKNVRELAASIGRDPKDLKFFAGITIIVGRTMEEAQAKYEAAKPNADIHAGLAKFSSYTGIDMSKYPLDVPFDFSGDTTINAVQGVISNFQAGDPNNTEPWTPRRLGEKMAFGGMYALAIGTPETIADYMIKWVEETDIDGWNLYYVSNPENYEDIVELLVPELQQRGVLWADYPVPGGTLRENMYCTPGRSRLASPHPAAKIRLDRENGIIPIIDKLKDVSLGGSKDSA